MFKLHRCAEVTLPAECPKIVPNQEHVIPNGWVWKTEDEPDVNAGIDVWGNSIAGFKCSRKPDIAKTKTAHVDISFK